MRGLEILAWILVLGIFGGLVIAVPVTRSVKKCTWEEAVVAVLKFIGLIEEKPNLVLNDSTLKKKLLQTVQPYSAEPDLIIKETVKVDQETEKEIEYSYHIRPDYHGGLPCIKITFVPKPETDMTLLGYILTDVFRNYVRVYYPDRAIYCMADVVQDKCTCEIEIRFCWTDEERKYFQKSGDALLHINREKATLLHERPSYQMLNQKLKAAKEKEVDRDQEEAPATEKKTAD